MASASLPVVMTFRWKVVPDAFLHHRVTWQHDDVISQNGWVADVRVLFAGNDDVLVVENGLGKGRNHCSRSGV